MGVLPIPLSYEAVKRFGSALQVRAHVRVKDGENWLPTSSVIAGSGDWIDDNTTRVAFPASGLPSEIDAVAAIINGAVGEYNPSTYQQAPGLQLTGDGRVTLSVYAKEGSAARFGIGIEDASLGVTAAAWWDWVSGEPDPWSWNSWSEIGAESVGADWWRVWIDLDLVGLGLPDAGNLRYHLMPVNGSGGGWTAFAAPQLERAHPTPLVWIPTFGGPASGRPGTYLDLTGAEKIVSCNPITRARERKFGVVQASSYQVALADGGGNAIAMNMPGARVALDVGLYRPEESLTRWARAATGRVDSCEVTSEGLVVIDFTESLKDLIDSTLPRDMGFFADPYVSTPKPEAVGEGSSSYDDEHPPTFSGSPDVEDEDIVIEFHGATSFTVTDGAGVEHGPFSIGSSASFPTRANPSGNAITIPSDGWGGGTFADGDRFTFATSRARASNELQAMGMIKHLIEDVAQIKAYDPETGDEESPFGTEAEWTAADAAHSDAHVSGEFGRGTKIIEMIQELLAICHASLYPLPDGKIGCWYLHAADAGDLHLNGDPGRGDVSILSARVCDDLTDTCGAVFWTYYNPDGVECWIRVSTDDTDAPGVTLEQSTSWRVPALVIESSANVALNRFRHRRRLVKLDTTLIGATVDVTDAIIVTDSMVGLHGWRGDVAVVTLDVDANTASLEAWTDPTTTVTYARVGQARVDHGKVM